ncbi:hypothetical protein NIES4071_82130 [Calothrix sp. NIES-4071]|nr:hypothetical protein NIES4071_82130 [Calothrix sp. NIES-4071]BAZ62482.1 hypothetical protein NIES4105_82060 [Calothrix sp. NIES-4105]
MTHTTNGSANSSEFYLSQCHLDLLDALLEDEVTYPWNPALPESEDFFHQCEMQNAIDELLDSEGNERQEAFYSHLDTLWSNTAQSQCSTSVVLKSQLKENLQTAISSRIPHDWIEKIATKASELFNSSMSIADQLIEVAASVVPTLGADDLSVLARPYAYAMRSETNTLESTLQKVGQHQWDKLSEIEQARVSVAVAYYALKQLQTQAQE